MLAFSRTLTAVCYGVFVSAMMSFIVLPMSHVAHRPFSLPFFIVATVILILSMGFPLAIIGGQYYST